MSLEIVSLDPFRRLGRARGRVGFHTVAGRIPVKPGPPDPPSQPLVRETALREPDDEEAPWIERARAGNAEAFRWLVERHKDRIFAFAQRMLHSESDAEEVAQDAFVRAWRGLPGFRGEARFGTWLHSIVLRLSLDRLETLRRRRQREPDLESSLEPSVEGPDHDARLRARKLESLVARLSDAQRVVVTLYYYEERSVEDVARLLHMPENTVKTHLSRARAALREAWLSGDEK